VLVRNWRFLVEIRHVGRGRAEKEDVEGRCVWYKTGMEWQKMKIPLALGGGLKLARIDEGRQTPKPMRHWSLPGHFYFHLYHCRAELTMNGVKLPIRPGYAGLIPPGAALYDEWYSLSSHLFALFEPADPASKKVNMPAMQDLGGRFEGVVDRFQVALACFRSQPERAAARVCDILWDLAEPDQPVILPWSQCENAAVRLVCERIEQLLVGRLSVATLATSVDVTADYLTRLFHKHMGMTVREYIRKRRVDRARHLLVHSSLPLKVIAAQVGLPDAHLFNKTVRRELGVSPRKVRAGGVPPAEGRE
jgi:AraC-like DNA-binding protein